MKRTTLTANYLSTISWFDNTIVDWAQAGTQYFIDGRTKTKSQYTLAFDFDGSIISKDGTYAFVYKRFGTKGILLKQGEILREINRSYYCANVYEFPCAFVTINDVTYLIHCPIAYNQLDFENVETGEIITNTLKRKPADIFHSRLELNSENSVLLSKGWKWHPVDVVHVFNVIDCIATPTLLDKSEFLDFGVGVCTASFIDNDRILLGSSNEILDDETPILLPGHIAIWNLETKKLSNPVAVEAEFGNMIAINSSLTWDFYKFPKIINIASGLIIDQDKDIDSGQQRSAICRNTSPQIVPDRRSGQIAISGEDKIEILEV